MYILEYFLNVNTKVSAVQVKTCSAARNHTTAFVAESKDKKKHKWVMVQQREHKVHVVF